MNASVEAFVLAATDGRRTRAEALFVARPEIERDPWARLVMGRGWEGDPARRQTSRVFLSYALPREVVRDIAGRLRAASGGFAAPENLDGPPEAPSNLSPVPMSSDFLAQKPATG